MPRLTIVLSSFNRPGRLACAIDSVLAQDFRDLQLVVCDDASPDPRTQLVVHDAAERDSRVVPLFGMASPEEKERTCTFGALINAAVKLTDSEFVSYLCDSAEYLPKRCGRLVQHLDAQPDCSAVWGLQRWTRVDTHGRATEVVDHFEDPDKLEVHQGRDFVARLDRANFIDHNGVLERRCDVPWSESPVDWFYLDWRRWHRMALRGMRFDHVGWLGERKVCGPDSSGWLSGQGRTIAEVVRLRSGL